MLHIETIICLECFDERNIKNAILIRRVNKKGVYLLLLGRIYKTFQ